MTNLSRIALEMVQMSKPGRLAQYVEPQSEAGQLLQKDGWKPSSTRRVFAEQWEHDCPSCGARCRCYVPRQYCVHCA